MNETTNHSLIARALDLSNESAWNELYSNYHSFVHIALKQTGLSDIEQEVLIQDVIITLMRNLKKNDKSRGSFRGWFAKVIRYSAMETSRKNIAKRKRETRHYKNYRACTEGNKNLLEESIESEWKRFIMQKSLYNIKKYFCESHIFIFVELTLKTYLNKWV